MLWPQAVLALWLFSFATGSLAQPGGSHNETAPYRNVSAISTTSNTPSNTLSGTSSSVTQLSFSRSFSLGTGVVSDNGQTEPATSLSSPGSIRSFASRTLNSTLPVATAACTVNIPSANIDWWFLATYAFPVGTLTPSAENFSGGKSYLTMIPATTTFDVTSALVTDAVYVETTSYDSEFEWTFTFQEEYSVRPSAALTSVITRTAAAPLPTGNVIPVSEVNQYDLYDPWNLPAVTTALSVAPNSTFVATSASPFLYFTAYEVVSAGAITASDGRVSNGTSTETINLPHIHAYPYEVKGIEALATATGAVPEEFLQQIPHSSCSPGTVLGTVTVLVVVDIIYVNNQINSPFIIHFETTATGFEEEPTRVKANSKATSRPEPFTMPNLDEPNGPAGEIVTTLINPLVQNPAQSTDTAHEADSKPPSNSPSDHTIGTIGTNPVVVGPSSVVVVGTKTLQPGGPAITVGGTLVSLAPSGTAIIVGGTTSRLPENILDPIAPTRPGPPLLTVGSSTFTPNAATQFFLGPQQTLTPGGTATISGTIISLDSSANFFVVGGSTQVPAVPTGPAALQQADSRPQVLTVGSETFSIAPGGDQFIVDGQTLTPGGTITVDGTTIALDSEATALIINGQTTMINPLASPTITKPPVLTIGQETFNALPGYGTTFIISGQTLTPGGTITIRGLTVVLEPGATQLVYGSAGKSITKTLFPATKTQSMAVTTAQPSAGATSSNGEAAQTSSVKGAGTTQRSSTFGSWAVSLLVGLLSLI